MKYFQKSKIAFLLVTVLLFISNAEAVPGDLDTTFNGTGKSRIELGGAYSGANGAAIQSDGKLIMVGGEFGFSIARYNTDGSKDTSFGFLGELNLLKTIPNPQYSYAESVRIQTDGKILVAGRRCINTCNFTVVRINSDGSFDTSFGNNGVVSTPFSIGGQTTVNGFVNKMILQTDGKIVIVGRFGANTVNGGATVRYNTNGSLDTTFSGTGIRLDVANQQENFRDVAIQTDGKIVVVGTKCCITHSGGSGTAVNTAGIVRRFNANGSNDTSFGNNGYLEFVSQLYDENYSISAVSLITSTGQADKIVYSLKVSESPKFNYIALKQLNNNGTQDSTFDSFLSNFESVAAIIVLNAPIQSLSRILVAGDNTTGFRSTRVKLDGALDTTFGVNGFVQTDFPDYAIASTMVTRSGNIFLVGGTLIDFAAAKYDSNGVPDTTFGIDGKIIDDAGLGRCVVNNIITEPGGKSIISGSVGSFAPFGTITRFNTDGSLDAAFGVNGRFTLPEYIDGISRYTEFQEAVRQPDGKIIAVAPSTSSSSNSFVIVRINADGTPDTSFSGDGFEVFISPSRLYGNSLALQPDGKIVVAGELFVTPSDSDFVVYRFNSDGTPDLNFDIDGRVNTAFGFPKEVAKSVAIQTDNKIVVTGSVDGRFAAARYNPDGSLDTTFSFDGKVVVTIGTPDTGTLTPTGGNASALQADGKIIVVGASSNGANNDFTMVRFNTDGTTDNSFGSGGIVVTQTGEGQDAANDIAIQTDGKLIVVGSSSDGDFGASSEDFTIVRYNADGTLDSSFADPAPKAYGNGGIVLVDFGLGADKANSVALDFAGRAVVAGNSGNPAQFSVARINGNFAPTAANVSVSGRVLTTEGIGLRNAIVTITDSAGLIKSARSSTFGYFRFDEIEAGQSYIIAVNSKSYQFATRLIKVFDEVNDLTLTAIH